MTRDSFARDLATRFNFEVIADDNSGETSAIEMATAVCKQRGARSTLVVPADIPLIDSSELQQIVDNAPSGGAVLVPDAAGRGTNAAWRSPGDLFPLRFGNDSFLPHLAAAKATGLPCVVLELPGIARDVDRPEDLHELAAASGERRSQKLVRSWNLAQPESGLKIVKKKIVETRRSPGKRCRPAPVSARLGRFAFFRSWSAEKSAPENR